MIFDLTAIKDAAQKILREKGTETVLCFNGEMGAGKTTLIKQVCELLGVTDVMSSPTFSMVNEYLDGKDNPIYHFDCYRIESIAEAVNIGTEEYLFSGDLCLIEWSENIAELLPDHYLEININLVDKNKRELMIALHDGKKQAGI